ncbi:MAG: WD40-repeat-containing domain protein [Benjaminiella poitrasii]|nr:MAG: WD40-repeat-containing domain protein [Benjaminiella poitrasii]
MSQFSDISYEQLDEEMFTMSDEEENNIEQPQEIQGDQLSDNEEPTANERTTISPHQSPEEPSNHNADDKTESKNWASPLSSIMNLLSRSTRNTNNNQPIDNQSDQEQQKEEDIVIDVLDEELTCPICQDIMKEVYATKCGHSFCHVCISHHLRNQEDCPMCRSKLYRTEIYPNFQLNKLCAIRIKSHRFGLTRANFSINNFVEQNRNDPGKIASTLAEMLTYDEIIAICKEAIDGRSRAEFNEDETRNYLLNNFLTKLKQRNINAIRDVVQEMDTIEDDLGYLEGRMDNIANEDQQLNNEKNSSSRKKRRLSLILGEGVKNEQERLQEKQHSGEQENRQNEEERMEEESSADVDGELIYCSPMVGNTNADEQQGEGGNKVDNLRLASPVNLELRKMKSRIDERFKVLHDLYKTQFSGVDNRLKNLYLFSELIYEYTRYDQFVVRDTFYYANYSFNRRRMQQPTSSSIVSCIDFDRDDEFFAVGGVSREIKIFDFNSINFNENQSSISSTNQQQTSVKQHCPIRVIPSAAKLSCLTWSPYLKSQLISSDYDGRVVALDVMSGIRTHTFDEHTKRVWSVDVSDVNPTLIASGSDDMTVKVWSLSQYSKQSVCQLESKGNVCCVQFAPNNGHLLAVGSSDHTLSLYDLRNPAEPLQVCEGHKKAVSYIKWLNNREFVTASTDSTLKLWDCQTRECTRTFKGHTNIKNFVGLSVHDNWITCGSENNMLYTYNKHSSTPLFTYEFPKPFSSNGDNARIDSTSPVFVSAVCWRRSKSKLVAGNSKGIVKVLDLV